VVPLSYRTEDLGHEEPSDPRESRVFKNEASAIGLGLHAVGNDRGFAIFLPAPAIAKDVRFVDFKDFTVDDASPTRNGFADELELGPHFWREIDRPTCSPGGCPTRDPLRFGHGATVFNYFETKEALVLDRLDATMASLPGGLDGGGRDPIQSALELFENELRFMSDMVLTHDDPRAAAATMLRFGDLIRATPSLRAYVSDMMDRWVPVAAGILAARSGFSADDPEPQIAARAILGLWHVQAESLRRHLRRGDLDRLQRDVTEDVRRAAHLIGVGLSSLGTSVVPPVEP
jgi:AcrR family transcriptional regulator